MLTALPHRGRYFCMMFGMIWFGIWICMQWNDICV